MRRRSLDPAFRRASRANHILPDAVSLEIDHLHFASYFHCVFA
jgi:hypothetical protein